MRFQLTNVWVTPVAYDSLRDLSGSTAAARRAGRSAATNPMSARIASAAANTRGADAVTDQAVGRQSTLHTGSGVCAEACRS